MHLNASALSLANKVISKLGGLVWNCKRCINSIRPWPEFSLVYCTNNKHLINNADPMELEITNHFWGSRSEITNHFFFRNCILTEALFWYCVTLHTLLLFFLTNLLRQPSYVKSEDDSLDTWWDVDGQHPIDWILWTTFPNGGFSYPPNKHT